MYVPYRIGSHAIHGSWVDVFLRHLVYSDEGFSVEWSFGFTDSRLLNASTRLNLEAAAYYAGKWFEEVDRDAVFERVELVIDHLEAVSHATELPFQRTRSSNRRTVVFQRSRLATAERPHLTQATSCVRARYSK
jgi:hypothetical protein